MAGRRIVPKGIPQLNARQAQVLGSNTPGGDEILKNLNAYNEEIEEQAAAVGVDLVRAAPAPAPVAEAVEEEEEEEDFDAKLDRMLAEKRAREAAAAEAAAKQAAEAPAVAEEPPSVQQQVIQMLKDAVDAPSEAQIAAWKREYGASGVQAIALGEGNVYVFTYLNRAGFNAVQSRIAKAQEVGMDKDPEELMMESVLKQCVLYPKLGVKFFHTSRSGVIPTLYSSIMLHSFHLTPQQAMVLTTQL